MINDVKEGYKNKLKSRLYGLLCEFEKNGEWESFLDNILIELGGVPEEERSINYFSLIYKLNFLKYVKYEYFRKTIFDCMSLLSKENEHGLL